jgi:prolyl-tRNA synthetase
MSTPYTYNQLVIKSGLADQSVSRGSMNIRPYGFRLWELLKDQLNQRITNHGAVNALFPLLIPKSQLEKEAEHVSFFSKQCAVVTHYRLKDKPGGGLTVDPTAKLIEEMIVRPTSEAVIWPAFSNWIKSSRDLPLKINHWANIIRWEKRTKMFLRTTEFHWQECHTAHESGPEA